jgi:hypothetical protein
MQHDLISDANDAMRQVRRGRELKAMRESRLWKQLLDNMEETLFSLPNKPMVYYDVKLHPQCRRHALSRFK